MKGLCKTKEETIPVYTYKSNEVGRRTTSSSYKEKFKKLVMKLIHSQRIADDNSSQQDDILQDLNDRNKSR